MELQLNEQAKDYEGFEGLYAITSFGRVYSYKNKKFLKPGDNGHGYLTVILFKGDKKKTIRIHRAVAETFIPIPEELRGMRLDCCHLDDNRQNNRVDNLAWMTRA